MLATHLATSSRYVTREPDFFDGEPFVAGTQVLVRDVVGVWYSGVSPEQISDRMMKLVTMAQVFDVLSFYLDNQEEIDERIAWYAARPILNVPLSVRCYPYLDEVDAAIVAYRQERNAELDALEVSEPSQSGNVA